MKAHLINNNRFSNIGYRFDAAYHLSEGVQIRNAISNSPLGTTTIGESSERIFYGLRANRIYVSKKDHAIPFLTGANIMSGDLSNTKLVSKLYTPGIEEMTIKKGWVMVTRSGTVGQTALSNMIHEGKYGSEDIIRIIPNESTKPGVLFSYLASRYGHNLLTQGSFGAVIQHIETDFISSLPFPVFDKELQEKVDSLISASSSLREQAAIVLDEVVQSFNKKYPIKEETTKCFSRRINDMRLGLASYNNNLEVESFEKNYADISFKLKDKASKVFAPPLFKHIYLSKDNGYPFMTGSELTKYNLRYYRWLSPRGVKNISDYTVSKGTLLLYKSGTTDGGILGNVYIADNQLDGCCLSDHVIRIVFNDVRYAYWTFAFLKSAGGVRMLQSLATGTMIPFITPDRVSDLLIPQPDESFDEITAAVEKYIDCISDSKRMENEAISLIETEIEKWNN